MPETISQEAARAIYSALLALLWQIERDDGLDWEDDSPAMDMVRDARRAVQMVKESK